MKSPTTFLYDRAVAKQDAPTEGFRQWREAAQAQIPEPVIDACIFSRPSSYTANLGARQFGLLGKALKHQTQKSMAGGLPQHFILAVTDTEVVALARTMGGRGGALGKPGDEVARWSRSALQVTWKDGGYLLNATLSAGEEQVKCCVAKAPLSESFLQLLDDPARRTPAS